MRFLLIHHGYLYHPVGRYGNLPYYCILHVMEPSFASRCTAVAPTPISLQNAHTQNAHTRSRYLYRLYAGRRSHLISRQERNPNALNKISRNDSRLTLLRWPLPARKPPGMSLHG
jgi:hypothetical protein